MVKSTRKNIEEEKQQEEVGCKGGANAEYEEARAQRIKENMERMKNLGILDLSKKLQKPQKLKAFSRPRAQKTPEQSLALSPARRSSRLKDLPRISYAEKIPRSPAEKPIKNVKIHIPQGKNPEIYTEDDEKLLGDSQTDWTLFVDGYNEDKERIYDTYLGKSCHQCRQKTLGLRTVCSKCKSISGQFCGDCLYMRYGENVMEVNENPDWICPGCRGICNCSRCRRLKGWEPTGSIYRKAVNLGFKSVAHYLIHTFREKPDTNDAEIEKNDDDGDEHESNKEDGYEDDDFDDDNIED